nr:MAG TPA: hypothetical protein [Caudoviricetes sp.]
MHRVAIRVSRLDQRTVIRRNFAPVKDRYLVQVQVLNVTGHHAVLIAGIHVPVSKAEAPAHKVTMLGLRDHIGIGDSRFRSKPDIIFMQFEIAPLGRTKVTISVMIQQHVDIIVSFDGTLESPSLDPLTKLADTRIQRLAKPFYSVGSNVARDFDVTVSFHRD